MEKSEIIIIGCGFSGMLTALALAKKKIKSTIVEVKSINEESFFSDLRTTALTKSSKNYLETLGIWPLLQEFIGEIKDIYVVDNKAPEIIHFAASQVHSEEVGYIIKNSDFKKILLTAILTNNYITIKDKCEYSLLEVNEHHNILTLNNDVIKCNLLIICENNSKIRNYYFSNYIEKNYHQSALVFNVKHQHNHEGTAVEHFMPNGPFAILPLKDQNCSSIVWTLPTSQANLMQNLEPKEFKYLVQRNFGEFLGEVNIDSAIANFKLKAKIVKNYYYNRIVLVADSAHIIHPLAGQGLNQGIKDIEALTDIIYNSGINNRTLHKYEKIRKEDNMAMFLITDKLNSIFSYNSLIPKPFRRTGFLVIDKFHPLKKRLIKYARGER